MSTLRVSSDPDAMDVAAVHAVLTRMYWSEGVPLEVVRRAISGSMPFGVFDGDQQVGFARVVTDRATFAYLADVYVIESHRGRGAARLMLETIMAHPELQGLRRWMLATRDAHGLYQQFGFERVHDATRLMQRVDDHAYHRNRLEEFE